MSGSRINTGTAILMTTMSVAVACPTFGWAAESATPSDASAAASPAAASADSSAADSSSSAMESVIVSAQRLNDARSGIQTQTGASTYTIDAAAIQAAPGGDNALLNQVALQAPDVVQDSFGQLHVRGEHNGLQFRLNGIILPEGNSVFGQALNAHLIESMKIITGALPAEFGLRTAGIIDLTTKSGLFEPHGEVSLYGGSHGEILPSFSHGGSSGNFNYFVSGDFLRNDLGIESPDGSSTPLHDRTTQYHGFGYFEYILDPDNRVSWVLGTSHGKFQIPDTPGLSTGNAFTVNGVSDFPSAGINENQTEITHFGIVSLQHSQGDFDVQTSLIARYSSLTFTPTPADPATGTLPDLLYTGISQNAYKRDVAYALQSDAAYHLNEWHILRAGMYVQHDKATSDTTSQVLPTDDTGAQTTDVPFAIVDNSDQTQWIESAYLQDEWKALSLVTINYGLRFDHYNAYTSGSQVSPRVNIVWKPLPDTTVHGGYSRYFSPPPFELVGSTSIAKFVNTTQPPTTLNSNSPEAEKANYYDLGVEQQLFTGFTAGVDTYFKQSVNLIDEGQFGAPIILTPFNYAHGKQYGAELALNYSPNKVFSAYGNLAYQRARGKEWTSSQFLFSPDDQAYVATHYIDLDHEQIITASAGASYLWSDTRFSVDMLEGSGLRANLVLPDGSSVPNGTHLPYYTQVNFGVSHAFTSWGPGSSKDAPTLRFDVINAFDRIYQIRNGTGVGVGAPQFGPRRGLFAGVTIPF